MSFPTVIKGREQKSVEIVGQVLLKIRTSNRRLGDCAEEDTCFQCSAGLRSFRGRTGEQRVLHFAEQIMTDGTPHRVFGEFLVYLHPKRAVEVVRQLIFKFVTKHSVYL